MQSTARKALGAVATLLIISGVAIAARRLRSQRTEKLPFPVRSALRHIR